MKNAGTIKYEPLDDAFADDFFSPLGNTKPYFKAAFEGFAGAGKTYTAAQVAVGLHKRIGSKKPVIIFDTEMASKFLKPLFDAAGIQVLVKESRSLADLKTTMQKCHQGLSDVLLIDSISHIWENFLEAYKQAPTKYGKAAKTRLEFQDWGIIKPAWKSEFSDPFVRDPYHIIMTGRAGYEYENEKNEETGKREIFKSGVKMKVEGETAYEPDLLVLMERLQEMEGGELKKVIRRAVIVKDRSTILDGKAIENPTFESFAPCIDVILSDPQKRSTLAEADASALMQMEEDKREWTRRRDIAIEKVEGYFTKVWPGQSAEVKAQRVKASEFAFGTPSWTAITALKPDALELGLNKLHEFAVMTLGAEAAKTREEPVPTSEPKNEAAA